MVRRRFQSGHVFARGKQRKVWVGRYLEPVLNNGKIKSVLRSKVIGLCSEMSKSAARHVLEGMLRAINEGTHKPTEEHASFQEFYQRWESDLLPTYRESTRAFYRGTAERWIRPYFRDWQINDIDPVALQRFLNAFRDRYSKSVLKHLRATLNCIFKTAVVWRYLRDNPTAGLRLPHGKDVRRAAVLSPKEMAQLIGHLQEPYATMVMLAVTSAMRESELLALQWGDFDFARMTVKVQRRVYRGQVAEPKTAKSTRELPLHPATAAALCRLPRRGEWVFPSPRGGGIYEPCAVVRNQFKPAAAKLGFAPITWRSFRRSAESAMHGAGVSLKAQQEILGHSQPNMTLVYAETNEASKRGAVARLGGLIFPNFPNLQLSVATENANSLILKGACSSDG